MAKGTAGETCMSESSVTTHEASVQRRSTEEVAPEAAEFRCAIRVALAEAGRPGVQVDTEW